MSEQTPKYGVSYVASAPEELKVGDRVETPDGAKVRIVKVDDNGSVWVENEDGSGEGFFKKDHLCALRKLPDTISFEDDSDNVKAFKAILNEMAETYKAKDSTYGNAYQDGFDRFGAVQLVARMYEKYCRIENLLVRNAYNKVPDESVADTLTDLAVQAICLRMLLQKNDFENVD